MNCRMDDLRCKEVINVKDGTKLGFINDIELDTKTANLKAIVVYGRLRFLGIFGREEDIIIPWNDIKLIGDDTVLVHFERVCKEMKKGGISSFFDRISF